MQPRRERVLHSDLALPNDQDVPTRIGGEPLEPSVPLLVSAKLLDPKISPCSRHVSEIAAFVVVPKAAMNENDLPAAWKGDVRTTRCRFPLQPEAIPELVQ